MSKRDYHTSYELEKLLSQSSERVAENIQRQRKLKHEILKLRKARRQLEAVPDDVKQWFEETDELDEEEEE